MKRQLKLIWDFRGPTAKKTAQHHEVHLKEYALSEQLRIGTTGLQEWSDTHCSAYLIVLDSEMKKVRDALRPHRGQEYKEK